MTQNTDFLPENYEAPKGGGGYMKFQKGENRFRIMSKPIIGWEDWTPEKKPVRYHMADKPSQPLVEGKQIKHFWAFIVYDFSSREIKILEITQSSIQNAIQTLVKDEDWGNPYGYDINVTRSGDGMETEYQVSPKPHKKVTAEMEKSYLEKPISLEVLFDGADPFKAEKGITPMNSMPF